MKRLLPAITLLSMSYFGNAQVAKTELYDLIKKICTDSTGYLNVGDWEKKFPVKECRQ